MLHSRKLKYSVNPELIDKQPPSNKTFFCTGFQSIEDTIEELAITIHEEGWAFSYQFENGHRNKANFVATDIACVDVDGGITLSEAQNNQFVQDYCTLLYTTPSHGLEQHRFRLVFVLARTVTDRSEITAISRSLARRFDGDMSATDAARVFYGCKDCHYQIFEKYIPEDVMNELIQDGKVVHTNDSINNNNSTTNRSMLRLDPDTILTASSGQKVLIKDIKKSTSVHCPYHLDSNPSAFVAINKNGKTFLHCKSCNKTWWMKSKDDEDQYDFYSFEQSIERIFNKAKNTLHVIDSLFGDMIEPIKIHPKSITVDSTQYLDIPRFEDGLTFIKSPKGSGKTTYLSEQIKKTIYHIPSLIDYEDVTDFETEISFISNQRILLIGHRQALIGDLCNKLNLNCYLDDDKFNKSEIRHRKKKYGVCLDSLEKVKGFDYDIIIIDEVEQVLSHFLSDTIGEKRRGLFRLFSNIIQKTNKVVALDADLGWTSFITLTSLTHSYQSVGSVTGKKQPVQHKPVHIYINNYQPGKNKIQIYQNKDHLIEIMKQRIVSGERVFITSNSKKKIDNLHEAIKAFLDENGIKKSIICVTSENSRSEDVQRFIKNIKQEVLNYDVVLSSPSLGTGIDITFEHSAQEIDCVFGFFENRINSHFEVDQQLARVRHPKEVHVWVCPSRYYFETDFGIVMSDQLHDALVDVADEGIYNFKNKIQSDIDPFYIMAAMIISQQRASKNNLKYNFVNYKIHNGTEIVHIKRDEDLSDLGKEFYEIGKNIQKAQYVQNILGASVLNKYQYNIIKEKKEGNSGDISKSEMNSYTRTRIELFYGAVVDDDVIRLDNNVKYRRCVRRLESLLWLMSSLKTGNDIDKGFDLFSFHNKILENDIAPYKLLYELLSVTPLINNYEFDVSCKISMVDLDAFLKLVLKSKSIIETQLDITFRSDIQNNPVRMLSNIISEIGLKLNKTKAKTVNGHKIYYYTLYEDGYNTIMDVVQRRKTNGMTGWAFVDRQYNFEYKDIELAYLEGMENKYVI